ncbi:type IV secretory system conjugative DNA transfer family protein [Peptoniphilus equinus]|uniref:Type IV secretory system conjugative DNA transfer family protein n=1 Tax=Peptoniphilus equinus TaxID=3016343 RepID=A0ABY7QRB0_9FIRM|nr:type IV secretory system conjugative DNA transfer family protein [Peptoniphilus equinus]WBW49326.1 type IV secretory system conjugative DNA transfer family protein [Peptoniphilus equinus]
MTKIIDGIVRDLRSLKSSFFYTLRTVDKKNLFIQFFPYILIYLVLNRFFFLVSVLGFAQALANFTMVLTFDIVLFPIYSTMWQAFLATLAVGFLVYQKIANSKKFRKGEEYGSAKWSTLKDIAPYVNKNDDEDNILLTKTEKITMEERLPQEKIKYGRNKNVLIVGGSGSGKTRGYVKPNLMQMHSSYVVTDPKGTVLVECGKMLEKGKIVVKDVKTEKGVVKKKVRERYKIKVFNTINFEKSMHYNPLAYVHSEKDILKLVDTLMLNTKGEGNHSGDDFWTKAEKLLYNAFIAYIVFELKEEDRNFNTLLDMLENADAREDDENHLNVVDMMFAELAEEKPDCFAVSQYEGYKKAAGKTAKSILISCSARLAPFCIKELRDIMSYDDLELDKIGDRKTALFIIVSDTDDTFNFVVAMLYTQLFNLLCERADDVYNGKLPVHVRCLLDEFANIGQIPKFEKLIATIRSRRISANIILQANSQLKDIYKDKAGTIIGNCDITLFLGGKETETAKELEATLGKETIDLLNTSENRGVQRSSGLSYQKTGRSLMSQDEVAVMDGNKCILQIRGVRPFFSDKYDITQHPRYSMLSDADEKNIFDIKSYLNSMMIHSKHQRLQRQINTRHAIEDVCEANNIPMQ